MKKHRPDPVPKAKSRIADGGKRGAARPKPAVLPRLVEHFGSIQQMADALRINREAIYEWTVIPWRHVLSLATLTGIPAEELRPPVDPPPSPKRDRSRVKAMT